MLRDSRGDLKTWVPVAMWVLGSLVLIVPLSIGVMRSQHAWENKCHSHGGIVTDSTDTATVVAPVVGAKNQPGVAVGVSSKTTYFCVVGGKIIDTKRG